MVAQYQFDFGLRPSVAYLQSKGKDIEGFGDRDILKYVDVGATYYFNKTCPPTLTTKSTCWTTMNSPVVPVSLPTTWLLWAWFTSSKHVEVTKKAPLAPFMPV